MNLRENEVKAINIQFDPSYTINPPPATIAACGIVVGKVNINYDDTSATVDIQMPPTSDSKDSNFDINKDITKHLRNVSSLFKFINHENTNNATLPFTLHHQQLSHQQQCSVPMSVATQVNMLSVPNTTNPPAVITPVSVCNSHNGSISQSRPHQQPPDTTDRNTMLAWKNWELLNGHDFEECDPFNVSITPRSTEQDENETSIEIYCEHRQQTPTSTNDNNHVNFDDNEVRVTVSPVVRRVLSSSKKKSGEKEMQLQTSWSPHNKIINTVLPSPKVSSPVPSSSTPSSLCKTSISINSDEYNDMRREQELVMKKGVYFKDTIVEFGTVEMGSLSRQKVELCNTTDRDMTILIKDPDLPYVTLHNELIVKVISHNII